MLPSSYRLNKENDINVVLRRGRKSVGAYATLRTFPHSHTLPRIGFIVSKKVHNKPTVRNLIKRRMREITATLIPTLSPNLDYLFSAHSKAVNASFQDLKIDISQLLDFSNKNYHHHAKQSYSKPH